MIRLVIEPDVSVRDSIVECVLLCKKFEVGTTMTINGIVVECDFMFRGRNTDEVDRIHQQYKDDLHEVEEENKIKSGYYR